MAVERTATASWRGDLMDGSGEVSTQSGVVDNAIVNWSSRAEEADENTSPEELIAAAHATCVLMALAAGLGRAGTPPGSLESEATASFEQVGDGFRMTTMRLKIRGQVDGLDENAFREAAEQAKDNCPVTQALKGNVDLSLETSFG